jgi:hypothetical protein
MQMIQFASIVSLSELKLRKVICTEDSMMIEECQHRMEFQLIEGMNRKMQKIQFASIVNCPQVEVIEFVAYFLRDLGPKPESTRESTLELMQN